MDRITVFAGGLVLVVGFTFAASSVAAANAADIYAESCSVCHGDDGRGAVWGRQSFAVPPRNFRTNESRQELTRERMLASVAAGRPGTPMPGFATQLSNDEIAAVVDYIRDTFMRAGVDGFGHGEHLPGNTAYGPIGSAVDAMHAPLSEAYSGDPSRGALLYAENCVPCHGANGEGDGPRAYFIFPKPRNFHAAETRRYLSRRNLYNGIKFGVVGKEMPAWGKVLADDEIADVAEYVYRQFIQDMASGDGPH